MNTLSLFSGCGGLDLGLMRAGFETIFATDNDPTASKSYRANFPNVAFFEGSIADLTTQIIRDTADERLDEVDLLVGGPPCPPFSKSRFYRKDAPRGLNDPVGDVTLRGYLRVLSAVQPRAFLLENVPGFAYKIHREALTAVLETAEELGFTCSWRVLNAADYGVPQIRERFFLVGVRDGSFQFPEPTHAKDPERTLFEGAVLPWVTAGEAIDDLDTEANACDEGHVAGGKDRDLLIEVPPGQNYLYFTAERGHPAPRFKWRSRYWSFLLKLSPDLPSWTIQARRSNNMGPFHWRNRILRIEEARRLQTFPDEWILEGNVERQWRQVGNAVPPLLAERLGEAIRRHLEKNSRQEEDATWQTMAVT